VSASRRVAAILLRSGALVTAVVACAALNAAAATPGRPPLNQVGATGGPRAAGLIAAPAANGATAGSGPESRPGEANEPQVCSSCVPPLTYHGGPVMATGSATGLTVTPIFWEPSGARYVFPAKYENIIESYIANVAAASGNPDNVYSIDTEYYQVVQGVKQFVHYRIRSGATIIDTDAFPPDGCRPAPGYTACLTDRQLQTELGHVRGNLRLATGLAHFYPVFLPPRVETEDSDGSNSDTGYCGYHSASGQAADQTVYADIPYDRNACNAGESPNGDLQADGAVSTLSHELNEAITDPLSSRQGWTDSHGNQIADLCAQTYGRPLGSTSSANPGSTEYNQVINGGRYYLQQMFSNLAYSKFGTGKGCALSESLAEAGSTTGTDPNVATVGSAFADATPDIMPANGTSASVIVVTVDNRAGEGIAGDHVHFALGVQHGAGLCGKLSRNEQITDGSGNATVTYTASPFNVSCWVMATESDGGRAAESVIYQGTTKSESPAIVASFPTSLKAGGSAIFTLRTTNPSPHALPYARLDFAVFGGTPGAKNVDAAQVKLSYSTGGPKGRFIKIPLKGSTGSGSGIGGYLGPEQGITMSPGSSKTVTFKVALASDVPVSKAGPLVAFEGFLDQVNVASGSSSTLADTHATEVDVASTVQTNTLLYIAIGAGVIVVVLVTGGAVIRRRRKGHHPGRPAGTLTS
jgi:hypothetical protein